MHVAATPALSQEEVLRVAGLAPADPDDLTLEALCQRLEALVAAIVQRVGG